MVEVYEPIYKQKIKKLAQDSEIALLGEIAFLSHPPKFCIFIFVRMIEPDDS